MDLSKIDNLIKFSFKIFADLILYSTKVTFFAAGKNNNTQCTANYNT